MTSKPDGKPPAASDDARASEGSDAEARRAEAIDAADQRVDAQKRKAEESSSKHTDQDASGESELVAEAVEKGSDA